MPIKILSQFSPDVTYTPSNQVKIYNNRAYTVYKTTEPLSLVARICFFIKAFITLFRNRNDLHAARTGYKGIKVIVIAPEKIPFKINNEHHLTLQRTDDKLKQDSTQATIKHPVAILENVPVNIKKDKEFFLKTIKHGVCALKHAPKELLQDKEFFLEAIKYDIHILKYASKNVLQDRGFFLQAIEYDIEVLQHASKNLLQDREFFLKAIEHNIYVLKYASKDVLQDRGFFLQAVEYDIEVLQHASKNLLQDREFFLKAIEHNIYVLKYASKDLMQDRGFFLKAIEHDIYVLKYASENLLQDRNFFLKIIKHNTHVLKHASTELLQDREFFLKAIKCSANVLRYASKDLLQNREFFLKAVEFDKNILVHASKELKLDRQFFIECIKRDIDVLIWATEDLKHNESFFLEAIAQYGVDVLKYAANELISDEGFALLAVMQNGLALSHLSHSFRENKEIALAAIRQSDLALRFISSDLENDEEIIATILERSELHKLGDDLEQNKDIALRVVKRNGLLLQYLPDELKDDKEIVLAAVIQNGLAFSHASDQLKKDRELALISAKKEALAFYYASKELKNDKETVLLAIAQNCAVLSYISDDLLHNREFILELVKQDGLLLMYSPTKDAVTIETAHQAIIQKLQLWLEDPLQKDVLFAFASTIVDKQEDLFLHDEHPVLQKAIEAYCLTSQKRDSKNPYQIHFALQKALSEEVLVPDFAGYRKRVNKKGFTFADIPPGIIPLSTLFATLEQRGVNAKEVAELCCDATVPEIKANVLQSGTVIASLLTQKGQKEDSLPLTAMYLYAILKQISEADDTRQGNSLSPREVQLLKFCSMVKECSTGQRDAIEQYYINTIGRGALSSSQNKVETAIDQAIQMALKSVLAGDALAAELNYCSTQQSHNILYLQNRFHRQIGLVHTLSFDRHAGVLNSSLIQKDPKEVLAAIKQHLHPVDSVKQALDQFLNKKEISYMEFVEYFQKKCGLDQYESYIEFDEDTNPIGITPFAVEKALRKLEYLT
jgi:hypothetical protein